MVDDVATIALRKQLERGDRVPQLFAHRGMLILGLAGLLVFGLAERMYRLDAPGMLVEREFKALLRARGYFLASQSSTPGWRRDVADATQRDEPVLEPPVIERSMSLLYLAGGREQVPAARVLVALLWLAGAPLVFLIARDLVSIDGGVFATAYYILSPLSILVSRSLQPDALMMLLSLGCLYATVRYFRQPSASRLATVVALAALAALVRPVMTLAVLGAFGAASAVDAGWRGMVRLRVLLVAIAALLPAVLYYGWPDGSFSLDFEASFRPWLLVSGEFWRGWRQILVGQIGFTVLGLAAAGVIVLRSGRAVAIVAGLVAGYFAFGLLFPTRFYTHPEYHAQLIPVVAITAGALFATFTEYVRRAGARFTRWATLLVLLSIAPFEAFRQAQMRIGAQVFETASVGAEIGQRVGHSTRVVFVAPYHGLPLRYFAELAGASFPSAIDYPLYLRSGDRELSVSERLEALDFIPEYFVVTHFGEFEKRHGDLKEYLAGACARVDRTAQYLIYADCGDGPSHR